jgi:hypothetical protein
MKRISVIPLIALILGALLFRSCPSRVAPAERIIKRDTVVIRDTIYPPVPKPTVITIVRHDTVQLPAILIPKEATIPGDTAPHDREVIVPITRNTYTTEDYRAIVEGYRPRLVSMELYRKHTTITITRSPRWAVTVGPGIGYGPKGVQPYIGINFGYVLWGR